jgi:cyclophilin family peptidyl-prolyl cis-trans isomerase/HEAT repeat protein
MKKRRTLPGWSLWRIGLWTLLVVILALAVGFWALGSGPSRGGPGHGVGELPPGIRGEAPMTSAELEADRAAYLSLLALEDRRAPEPGDLDLMGGFLEHPLPGIRRVAARALGRLERGDAIPYLTRALDDPEPAVRGESANALAQAAFRGVGWEEAREALLGALAREADSRVRGELARALGRLRIPEGGMETRSEREARAQLLQTLSQEGGEVALGVARGALFLFRNAGGRWEGPGREDLLGALEALGAQTEAPAELRRSATAARVAGGLPPFRWVEGLQSDPDPEVRRLALTGLVGEDNAGVSPLLDRALGDPAPSVRIEAVLVGNRRRIAAQEGASSGPSCSRLAEAATDPHPAVTLAALEGLGIQGCEEALPLLRAVAAELPGARDGGWHAPLRALRSWTQLQEEDPEPRQLLGRALAHEDPFLRAHIARLAGALGALELVERLTDDPDSNVREATLAPLQALGSSRARSVLLRGVQSSDPQEVRTAARLLAASPEASVGSEPLLEAMRAVRSRGRATDRDAQLALLEALGVHGTSAAAPTLRSWVEDPDPRIAEAPSALLLRWTGESLPPAARGLPTLPLPGWALLLEMERGTLMLELSGGGPPVQIRLLPFEAPTTAARLLGLVQSGRLEGLTLHRVVPNFVVQGGSPGGNEYFGHGEYTRDELGRIGHWKGTVGVSTRGRDTGDGQLFVNLVDNLRLDHDYTVLGWVVSGMEALESHAEGGRILRARWVPEAP